jgi:hypothetical protein
MKIQYWTEQEDKIFREHYGKMSCKDIVSRGLLPGRSVSSLSNKANELALKGGFRKITHSFDEEFWRTPNHINAYWAGEISSDGCIMENRPGSYTVQLQVSTKDLEHLKKFKDAIQFSGPIRFYSKVCSLSLAKNTSEICYVSISRGALWANDLRNIWGIIPKKTYHIVPPKVDDNILKLCFVAGYLDGDGTITADYKKGRPLIRFTSCSRVIVDWFASLFNQLFPDNLKGQGASKSTDHAATHNCHYYSVSGFRALKIVDVMSRLPVPLMDRKWKNSRILAIMEDSKKRFPEAWSRRLPIEDEIDSYVASHPPLPSVPPISNEHSPVLV